MSAVSWEVHMRPKISKKEFESAAVIYWDINDYIEGIWSKERFKEAANAFNGAVVVHDVLQKNSTVHTEYNKITNTKLRKNSTILTHSPDKFTSEWALCNSEKEFKIRGKKLFEFVGNKLYNMNADLYHREGGKYHVGYKNKKGKYTVCEKDGILHFSSSSELDVGKPIYSVDLYEDISGKYFLRIEEKNSFYFERKDGKVELVKLTKEGSKGMIVRNHRDRLNSVRKIK